MTIQESVLACAVRQPNSMLMLEFLVQAGAAHDARTLNGQYVLVHWLKCSLY